MPATPYLLFGFDVTPDTPDADAIMRDVESRFPITSGIGSAGVANTFLVELPESRAPRIFRDVAIFLSDCDQASGDRLRWFVQLCRNPELAEG